MANNSVCIDIGNGVNELHFDEYEQEETLSDADECDEVQLHQVFKKSYSVQAEKALSINNLYVLHLDCKKQKICAGLSNNTSEVYEYMNTELKKTCELKEHKSNIVNVKFVDDNICYTGSYDGNIKQWDLRIPKKSVNTFIDTTTTDSENKKPFSCFDVSPNNRLICAGTELFEGDAFLIFWDIRNTKLLGAYWESHMDDVTRILFHPTNNDRLASCSTDGLINIYDLTETCEDDALKTSLNTESSVEQLLWVQKNNDDALAAVMHPSEVQLWSVEEGTPFYKFKREELTKEIKRKSPEHCYIANLHTNKTFEDLYILTGSNWHNGEIVRCLNVVNDKPQPYFTLYGNKQRLRTSHYVSEEEFLITGGEQGIISVWKPGQPESITPLKELNQKA